MDTSAKKTGREVARKMRGRDPGEARENPAAKGNDLNTLLRSLKESEQKFRSLFEAMDEGVALHEILYSDEGTPRNYRIVEVNPAFETNTGIPAERIRGGLASDVYGTGQAPYLEIYAAVADSGQPASFEVYFPPLDRHFHISVFSPKKGWFATVFTNITEQKKQEAARAEDHRKLTEQKTLFSGIINSVSSDIFSLDLQERYTSFNQAHAHTMSALFGVTIEEGRSFAECITVEKDKKAIQENLDRARSGETIAAELYAGDHALSRQYMDFSFSPIRDTAGGIIGIAVIAQNATGRKNAEKSLRASEERYRRLAENSQDVIFRLSLPDRRFEYVSPAALPLTGYSPEELCTNPDLTMDLIHPDFRESFRAIWDSLPKGEIPREYEYRILHKDKKPRWVHQRNTLVRDNAGRLVALEGIVTDITDRKHAELALYKTEERYRLISENTGDVIWLLNMETLRFSFISPSIERLLGYTVDECMALTLPAILTPESLAYVRQTIPLTLAAIRSGNDALRIQTHQVDQVRKDKTIITTEIVATLLENAETGQPEILGVTRDITERKRSQDALLESEEKYRSLVETTSDLVWEIDSEGNYTYISPRVTDLLGYRTEELIGKSAFEIMPPDEARLMLEVYEQCLKSHQPVASIVNRCIHKDGSIVVMETSAVPRFDKNGTFAGYRGIDRDITQRKRAQDALAESEERYRTFVESANEAIFIVQDGKIPFSNKNGLALIGYDSLYLATHQFLELVHPEDRNAALTRHMQRLKGEPLPPRAEMRVIDARGTVHWIEVDAVVVPWDGRPATLNFATDITNRKKADDALRESERSYHGLFNTVREAIYIQDEQGRFLNVNDGAVAMYGYPREFFLGKTPADISADGYNDLEILGERFALAFRGEPQQFEFWGKRSDGEIFPKEVRLYKGSYFGKDVLVAVASDITERKRAEEEIRRSGEKFRNLSVMLRMMCDNVPDMIWAKDLEKRYIFANKALCRDLLNAEDPDEAVGKTDLFFAQRERGRHPDDPSWHTFGEICRDTDQITMDAGTQMQFDESGNVQGKFLFLDVRKAPFIDEKGSMIGTVGSARNITEYKHAEEALKNSEKYLKTIFNSVQTGLVIVDPLTHTIMDVNPAAENLLGAQRENIVGSVCHHYICPADDGRCPVTDLGHTVDNAERLIVTAAGQKAILKTVVPVVLSGKRLLLESFIDISDRKRVEAALAESEEKFHLIFKNSNDAIYLFEITHSGMPGRIVDANEVALKHTGLPREVLLQKTFLEIHSGDLPAKSRSIMMELLTRGQVRFEADILRRDKSKLPVEVSAQFAKLNRKTYVIAISRDVSQRKREERALRIANQKLQLMNIVAWHDIQNKVTGLRGYIELSKDLVTDETMKKFIQSEEDVLKVIHQQLQYTKEYQEMGIHPQEWINLHQTLRMILSLAELGSIQVTLEVGDLEIFCDPVIAKVFSHFLANTKIHGKKATRIHIGYHETAEGLILAYEDNGVGIPDEQKKELFMRNVGTPSGFSLFFIHDLLEVSEMTIRETGISGEGVRFEIGIPRGIYRFGQKFS